MAPRSRDSATAPAGVRATAPCPLAPGAPASHRPGAHPALAPRLRAPACRPRRARRRPPARHGRAWPGARRDSRDLPSTPLRQVRPAAAGRCRAPAARCPGSRSGRARPPLRAPGRGGARSRRAAGPGRRLRSRTGSPVSTRASGARAGAATGRWGNRARRSGAGGRRAAGRCRDAAERRGAGRRRCAARGRRAGSGTVLPARAPGPVRPAGWRPAAPG